MRGFLLIVLLGSVAILLLDTSASVASELAQINYAYFSPASILIYGFFGWATAKRAGFWFSPLCGAILGLVESTLGWYISWIIGAGRIETEVTALVIGVTIFFVTGFGATISLIGGLFGRKSKAV